MGRRCVERAEEEVSVSNACRLTIFSLVGQMDKNEFGSARQILPAKHAVQSRWYSVTIYPEPEEVGAHRLDNA